MVSRHVAGTILPTVSKKKFYKQLKLHKLLTSNIHMSLHLQEELPYSRHLLCTVEVPGGQTNGGL